MPKRKKKNNFNWVIAGLAAGVFAWIAADFYFNVYQRPQKEIDVKNIQSQEPATEEQTEMPEENVAPELKDGFAIITYRDDRYGIEFKYPMVAGDARCLTPQKSDDGFWLGELYFFIADASEKMEDFMARQLRGVEVQRRDNITVAGVMAVKVDYQTAGMGRYGSSVFIENGKKLLEFGLLAGEAGEKCGGVDDYDDRLYQSVIATLKFAD